MIDILEAMGWELDGDHVCKKDCPEEACIAFEGAFYSFPWRKYRVRVVDVERLESQQELYAFLADHEEREHYRAKKHLIMGLADGTIERKKPEEWRKFG